MSLIAWLNNLTEEFIIQWANKGLLRRGSKQLEKQDVTQWQLNEDTAQAHIADFKQSLTGAGFDYAQCSCPASSSCFHLTCFLLGLKQLAKKQAEKAEDSQQHKQHSDELPTPWLIADEQQRLRLLGKANILRALRWMNQGIVAELSEDKHGLTALIYEKERYRLIIPRLDGLSASLCQCKKDRCAHRALVVMQASKEAGLISSEVIINTLDQGQIEVLQQLKQWLHSLALQGMSGLSRLQIDYGQALVIELQQADLAKPAKLQRSLVTLLEQEWQRQLISSPTRLRNVMAQLYAHMNALLQQPMPQSLLQLSGEHRRVYRVKQNLTLIGVAIEQWQTSTAYQGFSVYFYAPEEQQYYSYSEARSKEYNDNWQPEKALQQAQLGTEKLKKLVHCRFVLEKGWCSQDGRLSTRNGSLLKDIETYEKLDWSNYGYNLSALSSKISHAIKQNSYSADYSSWAIINITSLSELTFDRYLQLWSGEAIDNEAQPFKIILSAAQNNAAIVQRWQALKNTAQAVFGRWSVDKSLLSLTPVALYCTNRFESLT